MAEPKAPAARNRLPDVARIVGGVVVVAIVVGAGLWAERLTDDDLALPDEVAGASRDDSSNARTLATSNSERLSEAYDGAEAVTASYDTDEHTRILVTAVRARSGPPVPAVFTENQDWAQDGDVVCLVSKGQGSGSTLCQRDDGDLTVRVLVTGPAGVDTVVDATNDVWEDVS